MTQIIFQVAAIGCCIYTAYRLGLFIYKKLRKNNKTAKAVQVTSYETSDRINPAIEPARSFHPSLKSMPIVFQKKIQKRYRIRLHI